MNDCEFCHGEGYIDQMGLEPDDIRTVRCVCNPKTSVEEMMDDDSDVIRGYDDGEGPLETNQE